MPEHDQTGPLGYGPKTGRGAGFCAGDSHKQKEALKNQLNSINRRLEALEAMELQGN